ncbi:MAG: hypothetical protein Kow002_11860 [Anaerolineales bacterium]
MGQIFNQYSIIWIAASLLTLFGLLLFRQQPKLSNLLAFGVIVFGLLYAWNEVRPQQTPLMDNAQDVQAMIGQGTPVLLEFQSPF